MNESWIQAYVLLALRIDKLFRKVAHSWFVDTYYGPPEWKATVDAEPETPEPDLARAAMALADALPVQGFELQRAAFLERQVRAMETICRTLNGETFALADQPRVFGYETLQYFGTPRLRRGEEPTRQSHILALIGS